MVVDQCTVQDAKHPIYGVTHSDAEEAPLDLDRQNNLMVVQCITRSDANTLVHQTSDLYGVSLSDAKGDPLFGMMANITGIDGTYFICGLPITQIH